MLMKLPMVWGWSSSASSRKAKMGWKNAGKNTESGKEKLHLR